MPSATPPAPPPYKDAHLPVGRRVEDLLSRMTVEEKIRHLDMYWGKEVADMNGHEAAAWSEQKTAASFGDAGAGSVHDLYPLTADITNSIQRYALEKTRLGIPVLFIEEGLHGYSGLGSTSFPIPLQLSGSWDTTLLYDVGRTIATETRAHGIDMLLAPVQGVDHPDAVISEPKHFAVHGIPEAGSNTAPVLMGEREVRTAFLPVFEAAVREDGALAMMAAYSELDGIPCVDNKWLLTDVLLKEWGFKGFVLSNLGAIRMSLRDQAMKTALQNGLLRPDVHSVAVVGPLAASNYPGGYSNPQATAVSILDGLRRRAGSSLSISYEPGYTADSAAQNPLPATQNTLPAAQKPLPAAQNPPPAAQNPLPAAIDAVNKADVAIVALGEDPAVVGEGKDRAHLELSGPQMRLIQAVIATGKPVVVLLCNGRPLCIDWVAAHASTIVETWFSGEQGGLAIADILLGHTNPSGKLPITFPRSEGQIPYYYNHKPTSGHHYVDESDSPLFPFGFGLSYTHFGYSALAVSPARIPPGGSADVQVTVTNTGAVAGDEIVQLYIRDVVSSVTTPNLALKGFGRVSLNPGESRTLHFRLGPNQLSIWNRNMKKIVEPGEFKVMIGSSSADIRLTDSLWVIPHT